MPRTKYSLSGRVVVITGASAGIGAAAARAFARQGAHLVLAARRLDLLNALAEELPGLHPGAQVLAVPADLGRLEDIRRLVDQAQARFGGIDVLFNNAGFGRLDWLERLDPEADIASQVAVNLLSTIQATRQVLPLMQARRSGFILNMASMAGLIATPTYSIYAATKAAILGFSEALRREAAPWGVRVSVLCPSGVVTEFGARAGIRRRTGYTTPAWLRLSPEQVAGLAVRLAQQSRPPAVVVMPGLMQLAVWLNRLAPGFVDWVVTAGFTRRERAGEL